VSKNEFDCSCLCENIRFKVKLINLKMGVCHCSMCRKNTGGTGFSFFYSLTKPIFVNQKDLSIYNSVGIAERAFCNQCGTTIYYHRISDEGYCIPSGIIDNLNENEVIFDKDWYFSDKPKYYSFSENTKKA